MAIRTGTDTGSAARRKLCLEEAGLALLAAAAQDVQHGIAPQRARPHPCQRLAFQRREMRAGGLADEIGGAEDDGAVEALHAMSKGYLSPAQPAVPRRQRRAA